MDKDHLTQVSNYLYSPIDWLDSVVPDELKIYPHPYRDYPFLLKNILFDYSTMHSFIDKHYQEIERIGIIENNNGIFEAHNNKKIRNTYNLLPDDSFIQSYNRLFLHQKQSIEDFFKIALIQSTSPQILIYEEGCFYKRHSDNCSEIVDENFQIIEFKPVATHRIITTVLFLSNSSEDIINSNDFLGGELQFDYLFDKDNNIYSLKPKEGDFIAFLSNPYFSHNVQKVIKGRRISIVQWHNCIIN